jgi:hypothetical protein
MKKISLWAYTNKWSARIIILTIYLLLNITGIFLGDLLQSMQVNLPAYMPDLLIIPFAVACFYYPERKQKNSYRNFYYRQKCCDGVLVFITFLFIICLGNGAIMKSSLNTSSAISPTVLLPSKINLNILPTEKSTTTKTGFSIKDLRKNLKRDIKRLRNEYRNTSDGGKIALIILVSVVAAILFLLLLALACDLSCSGAEGAAWIVFLLGTALLVFLLIKVIRAINKPKIKPQPEPSPLPIA